MSKIRVLIIEDSLVVRELLKHIIGLDDRFEVVAAVESAEEGLSRLDALAPDVISLDIRLPGMNGLDATLQIMQRRPTPIVVVAANVDDDELNIAMNALRAGALSVVEKPVGVTNAAFESMARHLCTQLAIMSQVRVVRQGIDRGLRFGTTAEPPPPPPKGTRYAMLGLVASTGGPQALTQVLTGLGPDYPLPILLVQHITASFLDGFVSWLAGVTPFAVRIAQGGEVPEPGVIFVPRRSASASGRRQAGLVGLGPGAQPASVGVGAAVVHGRRSGPQRPGGDPDRHGQRRGRGHGRHAQGRRLHHRPGREHLRGLRHAAGGGEAARGQRGGAAAGDFPTIA